jgi:putative GTP pyrophosphokinase
MPEPVSKKVQAQIDEAVEHFEQHRESFDLLAETVHRLVSKHSLLRPFVHSAKYRVKDSSHLRDKLHRKADEAAAKRRAFRITAQNLFRTISDLAGVRILHLNTAQIQHIDPAIRRVLLDEAYQIVEGPVANTWDDEYRSYFDSISIPTSSRPSLYTSVHYVIQSSARSRIRCELQVRTLVEEVWGEVSHALNYPHETGSISCREQLKVLARVSSSCTRLVDSIFASHAEHSELTRPAPKAVRHG